MKPSLEADKFSNSKHLLGFALLYPAYDP